MSATTPPARQGVGVPLTRTQLKIYTYCRLNPDTATYHASLAFDIHGPLDPASLEIAVDSVVGRHEMLRARIVPNGARPFFLVADDGISLEQHVFADVQTLESDPRSPLVHENRPFELDRDPLARFALIQHRSDHHTFSIVVHHLVTDLWSMNLLCNELTLFYEACLVGSDPSPSAQMGSFADYAIEEHSQRGTEARARAVTYWRSVLAKGVPETCLPIEPPEQALAEGDIARMQLKGKDVQALRDLAERHRCTPFVVLLSAYFVFLHRLTGQERVSIGSFFANRSDPRFTNVCGLLFNDLPITVDCSLTATFEDIVRRVRDEFLDLLPHATTPFDRALVAEASRGTSNVLYEQHNVTCQLYESAPNRLQLEGCKVQQRRFYYGSKYDLMLYGSLADDELDLWFNYRLDKFDSQLVASWLDSFGGMLSDLVGEASLPIAEIALDPHGLERAKSARDEIRRRCRDTTGIQTHLDESTATFSDRIAVAGPYDGEWCELTYQELAEWAGRIVDDLRRTGVRPGDRVGVHCNRGVALVASHLAVLRAGAVSVPLNIDYPKERLRYIVRDSGALAVVADTGGGAAFAGATVLDPGRPFPAPGPSSHSRLTQRPAADDPAFLIYTSGTSGRPKGVLLSHRGVVNQVSHRKDLLAATVGARFCISLSTGFVTLPLQILMPLFSGACLLAYPDQVTSDPTRLFRRAASDGVSALEVTVSQLDRFVRAETAEGRVPTPQLPTVLVAGEKLRAASVTAFHQVHPAARLVNAYGQTECTGMTLCRVLDHGWRPPLDEGLATRNNIVLVCDAKGRPLPPGFIGQLYVSGEGLASGYWVDGACDQTNFVDHPTLGRTYRTGDLGRSRKSGAIEVLGRQDGQIKLRGVRIEPGEIEEVLRAIPGIEACAVAARPYPRDDLALVAYIEVVVDADLDDAAIRATLRSTLPEIMIPSVFCRLDRLPVSANGKIDRRSLPDPHLHGPAALEHDQGALSDVEQVVLRLWRSALEMPALGPDHNFFAAGGTSLQAVVLVGEMAAVFGIDISLDTIFRSPSARELAAVISQLRTPTGALSRT